MKKLYLALALLAVGGSAAASNPYPNQSSLWSRDESDFGTEIAIASTSGDTIAVLDVSESAPGPSAFIFQFINGVWTEVARLSPTDAPVSDVFDAQGVTIAPNGDFVAIAAGSHIYVFNRPTSGWHDMTESARLSTSAGSAASFTNMVGASEDTIAGVANGLCAGCNPEIAVYEKPSGAWKSMSGQSGTLVNSDDDQFQFYVGNIGVTDTLITAPAGPDGVDNVITFDKSLGGWTSANFGVIADPALSGLISVYGAALNGTTEVQSASGCVLAGCSHGDIQGIFLSQGPSWNPVTATLTTSAAGAQDLRGPVAISPNLVVGASEYNDLLFGYQKPGSGWADATESFSITLPGTIGSSLGLLATTDSTIVVGVGEAACPPTLAKLLDSSDCPQVYTYDSGAVTAAATDLVLAPAIAHGVTFVGKPFTLTFSISNESTTDAGSAVVAIPLSPVLSGIKVTTDRGSCSKTGSSMSCQLGTLAASAQATITLTATAPTKGQSLTQDATVTTTTPVRSLRDGVKSLTYRDDTPPVAHDMTLAATTGADIDTQLDGTDADGDPLTYTILTRPVNLGLNQTTDGQARVIVSAPANFVGTDSFTYKVNDGFIDSSIGTVKITYTAPPKKGGGTLPPIMMLLLGIMLMWRRTFSRSTGR